MILGCAYMSETLRAIPLTPHHEVLSQSCH